MSTENHFRAEIAFLRRKMPTIHVEWKVLPAVSQVMSQQYKIKAHVDQLREKLYLMLRNKAGNKFDDMCFIASSANGFRLVVNIIKLREVFADEIDGWSGGGGRGIRPIDAKYIAMRRGRR